MKVIREFPVLSEPDWTNFRKEFVARSRPVLIRGVERDRDLLSGFSPDAIKRTAGSAIVTARETDDEFAAFFGGRRGVVQLSLGEYVDRVLSTRPGDQRPPYFGNVKITDPSVQDIFRSRKLSVFPGVIPEGHSEIRIWLAAPGQRSTIHNDPYHNFNFQLYGRKTFILFSPNQHEWLYPKRLHAGLWASPIDPMHCEYDRYPAFKNAEALRATLGPGDMIYVPMFWWHQASSETPSVNLNCWMETPGPLWTEARALKWTPR